MVRRSGEHMRSIITILSSIGFIAAAPAPVQGWSSQHWLEDLAQAQQAFKTKYANIDWLEKDREVPLDSLFRRASNRLGSARSDEDARAVFDRLVRRVGDGHVSIGWRQGPAPRSSTVSAPPHSNDVCHDLGFDEGRSAAGTAASLPDYRPVGATGPFPAGIVQIGARKVGVIRIAGFEPQGAPQICRAALQALHVSASKSCDDKCQDAILTWSYAKLTTDLEGQVRLLQASGATVLLVDITNNGGGTEWAEAAARILSPKALTSERRGFVRGQHWSEQWEGLAAQLRQAAASADTLDRARLQSWLAEAEQARRDADQTCIEAKRCALVARAGYATGLVGAAQAGAFAGKPWADLVFNIAQFPYHDSVWSGPLAVLVDDETWSAAEEFAAVLQDNRAAVIVGNRTGGAGCGHTNGGTPTTLKNSGAILELPDCVRFRADGSNEVAGVIPDILTGMKASDGRTFKAKLIAARLPDVINLAVERQQR